MKKIIVATLSLSMLLTGCTEETHKVMRIVDGDTIELDNNQKVRFLGIDTPERGCPGYQEAKKNLQDTLLAKRIVLVSDGKQDTDKYGRLLRYVELGGRDIGMKQIKDGLADARYDSRDGYPKHSREDKYVVADVKKNPLCPKK